MKVTAETVIQELEQKDKAIFGWAATLEVKDIVSQKNAENLLADAKFAQKRATESLKFITDPIRESEKRVRDLFRPYLDKLDLCISRINTLLGDYHREQERIAREEQLYLAAETTAKFAEAEESGEIVELPTMAIQTPAKTSRAEIATTSYVENVDIVIVTPDLVPRDLCEPSMTKIRARIKSGIKVIPGVLITPKYDVRTRRLQ